MAQQGSKEGQDEAALHLIDRPGFYLDLGANHPTIASNSWRLRQAGWTGFSIDRKIPEETCENYIVGDVSKMDLGKLLIHVPPIDYISFDVDKATIPALANFPFEAHPFTFMTFEHDLYRDGGLFKKQHCIERLRQGNYRIVAENVMFGEKPFEDWWVNLDRINPAILQCYTKNVTWQIALDKLKLYKP